MLDHCFWLQTRITVPQESEFGPILFKLFKDDLHDRSECTFSKFADYIKLGGVADIPEGHAYIQWDLDRLEELADKNLLKFGKAKCKVLHLGQNNHVHQFVLVATQLERSPSSPEKRWWFWWTPRWTGANNVPLQKSLMVPWAILGWVLPAGWGRWPFLATQHWWFHTYTTVSSSGLLSARDTEECPMKGHKDD